MLLLTLLLHLLVAHLLTARDVPVPLAVKKDSQYLVKHTDSCPDVGYFFKRETVPNSIEPGPCYLCFCQGDNTAVCWKRDNRRCNVESFHYHGVGKRDTRIRRSPGFADLFFRDATRDVLTKSEKPQCKPFESSFSDDCPPADWCTGCTVCDCDAHGRWDCHVLSFCPEDKGKKKSKRKGSGPARKVVGKKPVKRNNIPKAIAGIESRKSPSINPPKSNKGKKNKATTKTTKKVVTKSSNVPLTKTTPSLRRKSNSQTTPPKHIVKKSIPFRPGVTSNPIIMRTPVRIKNINKSNATKKMIIKKNLATHKPIDIHSSKLNFEMEIAKKVMKKVMANLRKSMTGEMENISKLATAAAQKSSPIKRKIKPVKPGLKHKGKAKPPKKVNKRQVMVPRRTPTQKPQKKQFRKPIKKTIWNHPKQYVRNKRDLIKEGNITTSRAQVYKAVDDSVKSNFAVKLDADSTSSNSSKNKFSLPIANNFLIPGMKRLPNPILTRSTLPDSKYYKYSVSIEQQAGPTTKVEMSSYLKSKEANNINVTETIINLMRPDITPSISVKKSGKPEEIYKMNISGEMASYPEANDLKYSKWTNVKLTKEKKFKPYERHKAMIKFLTPMNLTLIEAHKRILHRKDVERSPWKKMNNRKFNLVKLLKYKQKIIRNHKTLNVIEKIEKQLIPTEKQKNSTSIAITSSKVGDLQSILGKLLKGFSNSSNNTNSYRKPKKFSVIRYLRRIFNKMFRHKKTSRFSKHQIIESLCESLGPCKVSMNDKKVLKAKLMAIDSETLNIMKTVKVIKGLLKLIDIPLIEDKDSIKKNCNSDILKLNTILKDGYATNITFTETQKTQIEYIKKNTQDFIESVSKFASLLNDIIALLTKHNRNVNRTNRTLRHTDMKKDLIEDNPFQSLKSLLVKYNLVQNSFLKQMYEQLNNFEYKMTENPKVSEVLDLNNTVAIENFSRNIIQNLRKLKRLAQTLSSSGRSKREAITRDDDAIEYLLMLMEYLLKQNHPLDAAPVNDGIDLLIEAIKSAPDIKPIKKKVLDYTPAMESDITTIPSTNDPGDSEDDSPDSPPNNEKGSSVEYIAKPKQEYNEDKQKLEENKELADMVVDEDKDPDDKYQFDRRIHKMYDVTEAAFNSRANDNIVAEAENGPEITTSPSALEVEIVSSNKGESEGGKDETVDIVEKPTVMEINNLNKQSGGGGAEEKKFEVFSGDIDEEVIVPGTVTLTASEAPFDSTTDLTTQTKKLKNKMRHLNLQSFDSESIDKKYKLEWIEENFGREKEVSEMDVNNTTTTIHVSPKTTITTSTTNTVDMSVLTREVDDDADKKIKTKINAEDVMFRKQMDLLNSLDYGTEKTDVDESESKDGNIADDRYSNDAFASYFV